MVEIYGIGPGGGGGSGRKGAAASARFGGGGGGAGCSVRRMVPASVLAGTATITIPTPPTGGAAVTVNSTNGNPGSAAVHSIFNDGVYVFYARGGSPGLGGTAAAGTGGGLAQGDWIGSDGADSSATAAPAAAASGVGVNVNAPAGGGAGGGISTGNVAFAGSAGGTGSLYSHVPALTGGTAGPVATVGGAGTNAAVGEWTGGGGGGGGGGRVAGTPAGTGGAGGRYGGGGGGGGAGVDSVSNSGAGGVGGPGMMMVITYLSGT